MLKTANGRNKLQSETVIKHKYESFGGGMVRDTPASEIAGDAVSDLINAIAFPQFITGRTGSFRHSNLELPTLLDNTGIERDDYEATKTGFQITKTAGVDFDSSDRNTYFVWPDGTHDLIVLVDSADTITVKSDTAHDPATGGSPARMRGTMHSIEYHTEKRFIVMHIDTRIFYTDVNFTAWTEIPKASFDNPNNSDSELHEFDDFFFLFNDNGVFRIDLQEEEPLYFKVNYDAPLRTLNAAQSPASSFPDPLRPFIRRYLYSTTRLSGSGDRERTTIGTLLKWESGTQKPLPENEFKDYTEVFAPKPIGPGTDTYETLECEVPGSVATFRAVEDGEFIFALNESGNQIVGPIDFSGVASEEEVAQRIQDALRNVSHEDFDNAICEWDPDLNGGSGGYSFHAGIETGNTIGIGSPSHSEYIEATTGDGTDLSSSTYLHGRFADLGASNAADITIDVVTPILDLQIPVNQRLATHYSVYGTLDVGVNGTDPTTGVGNNSERYIHIADVPVLKAFVGSQVGNTVTAPAGTFSIHDLGTFIKWADGANQGIISTFVSDTTVTVLTSVTKGPESAAMGAGNSGNVGVITASQTGTNVERTVGDIFVSADVGRTIFFASGEERLITEFIDANNVTVLQPGAVASTAAAFKPDKRGFADFANDTELKNKINFFQLLGIRFLEPVPNTDLGVIVPGFIVSAEKEKRKVYYFGLGDEPWKAGQHRPEHQRLKAKTAVRKLANFPDLLIVYGTHSTERTDTNVFNSADNLIVGEVVPKLPNLQESDGDVGIMDASSLATITDGQQLVITSEPAIRVFDGYKYTANLTVNPASGQPIVLSDISSLQARMACHYDRNAGFVIWGSKTITQGFDTHETDFSLRYAVINEQGQGWSEYRGEWVFPEVRISPIKVYDTNNQVFIIVMDAVTGHPHRISLREGPAGSGLTQVFKDKANLVADSGTEIECEVLGKEMVASSEKNLLEHLQSDFYLRPFDETNKGAAGYDEQGFRDAQEFTIEFLEDGNILATTDAENIPPRGNITSDQKLQPRRLQERIKTTTSEFNLVGWEMRAVEKDRSIGGDERVLTEHTEQEAFNQPLVWVM